jgi:hypothetical protein
MRPRRLRSRHLDSSADGELLDVFLVSARGTVFVIGVVLEATGYARLGSGGRHIAHLLWGGRGMLVAINLPLRFLWSTTRLIAATVGGAGFGAFVDELGKFVTADNNYFFKPTAAALVYALFVILVLATREVRRVSSLGPEESLVNDVEIAEKLAMGTLTADDRDRALHLLAPADPAHPHCRPAANRPSAEPTWPGSRSRVSAGPARQRARDTP